MSMTPTQSAGHTKEEELLPCPFCGGPAAYAFADAGAPYPGGYPTVYCANSEIGKCLSDAYHCPGKCRTEDEPSFKATAIEMWNRRANVPDPDAAIRQAREVMKDAILQIEYLHDKFRPTGTGNAVIANLAAALAALTPETKGEVTP